MNHSVGDTYVDICSHLQLFVQIFSYLFKPSVICSNNFIIIVFFSLAGVPLSICPSTAGTCCTKEMESNLLAWSSQQFKLALDKRASQISTSLRTKMAKIEGKAWQTGFDFC